MAGAQQSPFILEPVERRAGLNRRRFRDEYQRPQRPVVLTDVATAWPALRKWTPEFLKTTYGHLKVKLFGDGSHGDNYMSSVRSVRFDEYLEMLESGPTDMRLFIFNLLAQAPEMRGDYTLPEFMTGFSSLRPPFFFGGKGAHVPLHYDIDLFHLLRTQIYGECRVVVFPLEESRRLYRHPFTVRSYVNIHQPDLEEFPELEGARGYETVCAPGDMLYIPSGYWHDVTYNTPGWAMTLRARAGLGRGVIALRNLLFSMPVDRTMNRLAPERWFAWKEAGARSAAASTGRPAR